MPVFIHGTFDFLLMVPHDFVFYFGIRVFLAICTMVFGFVYCRFVWLQMDNVCTVNVKEMQVQGCVSVPRCCCCECDCCCSTCQQTDPLLAEAQAKRLAQTAA